MSSVLSPPTAPVGTLALLETARPRQWTKNLLVLGAPAAAGELLTPHIALAAGWATLSFTLAAVATYFINDVADLAADRLHPVKSGRPVATGRISPSLARSVSAGVAVLALVIAALLGWACLTVVAGYLALTTAYSAKLKHIPVVDILVVAAGFLLRAICGAAATGLPLSNWFLLVAMFGSLYLVTAKRLAQLAREGTERPVLASYPVDWLRQVQTMALTGTVMAYAMWAFERIGEEVFRPILSLSFLPFLAILMRYGLIVAQGGGETPEKLLFSDRFLQLSGVSWVALVFWGLYLG